MNLPPNVIDLIGQPASQILEYKAVLPPSRALAQMICAFANTDGGYIVLGIVTTGATPEIKGISEDFMADSVTHRAVQLITPTPSVQSSYINHTGTRLFVIKTEKSLVTVSTESKIYIRQGDRNVLTNGAAGAFKNKYPVVKALGDKLTQWKTNSSSAMVKTLEHYLSVLHIIDDSEPLLFPVSSTVPTQVPEGKIMMRILYSSCADNFETYLTELLLEIYLAVPAALKSEEQVTVKEVLDCADIQDFVLYFAKKKLSNLQKGSVKGFIAENKQLKVLDVLDEPKQKEIEKLMQIRHLYSHRNGIVDAKFLRLFPHTLAMNAEHQLTLEQMLKNIAYFAEMIYLIDEKAIQKFNLATVV